MGNLDRPRHGWEGISNGGEIYGNPSSKFSYEDVYDGHMINGDGSEIRKLLDRVYPIMDYEMGEIYSLSEKEVSRVNEKTIKDILKSLGSKISEIYSMSEKEIDRISILFNEQLNRDLNNNFLRNNHLSFNATIRCLKCIYDVMKNDNKYTFDARYKVEKLYEKYLDAYLIEAVKHPTFRGLPRTPAVESVGLKTNEPIIKQQTNPIDYSILPDYSLTLLEMCADQMQEKQDEIKQTQETKISYPSFEKYEKVKSDLSRTSISIPKEIQKIEENTVVLISQIENKNQEQERIKQQKIEIELMSLKQEINRVENETLEIQKRIKFISSETIGSYFKNYTQRNFSNEYNQYEQAKNMVNQHSNNYNSISDLKEKFQKVTEELQFYKNIQPTYERYYEIYNQMLKERKDEKIQENELEKIYNLIHSEENDRLRQSNSLYTAWDLSDKKIPIKYQGMTYEQVEQLINEERSQRELENQEKAFREGLINKAIRKDLGVSEDYNLNDVQIRNLRVAFDGYSNEELRNFVDGVATKADNGIKKLEPIDLSSLLEESENKAQRCNQLINEILQLMYPDGLDYVPLPDITNRLKSMSLEELQQLKSEFEPPIIENTQGGMKK